MFAALTAIFAKIGVENINSDCATFIRTIVILVTPAFILAATGQFQGPGRPAAGPNYSWCCRDWRLAIRGSAISAR